MYQRMWLVDGALTSPGGGATIAERSDEPDYQRTKLGFRPVFTACPG